MVNLSQLKRKERPICGFVGARIDEDTKRQFEEFCRDQQLAVSTVLVAMIIDIIDKHKKSKISEE